MATYHGRSKPRCCQYPEGTDNNASWNCSITSFLGKVTRFHVARHPPPQFKFHLGFGGMRVFRWTGSVAFLGDPNSTSLGHVQKTKCRGRVTELGYALRVRIIHVTREKVSNVKVPVAPFFFVTPHVEATTTCTL